MSTFSDRCGEYKVHIYNFSTQKSKQGEFVCGAGTWQLNLGYCVCLVNCHRAMSLASLFVIFNSEAKTKLFWLALNSET